MNWVGLTYIIICSILLLYYLLVFSRLYFSKPKQYAPEKMPPVSIVICAKNEAENLRQNLKVVMIQNYPNFEVIVVNDQSTDDTAKVVEYYIERNANLRLINVKKEVEKPLPGKKFPIKIGIEATTHNIVVVTDADCKPANTLWLKTLVAEFLAETEFVLGYAPYNKHSGFLNKLIRYDNLMTGMQYLGFTLAGMPYMGVGRNMAFRKNQYLNYEETPKSKKLMSGDDDLFVNKKALKSSTEISINKDSFMYSEPKASWADWMNQKTRHTKTSFHYKLTNQLVLFVFALSNFAFYFFPLTAFLVPTNNLLLVIPFFVVFLFKMTIHNKIAIKLNNEDLVLWSFLLDLFFVIHLPILFVKSLFSKVDTWK